MKFKLCVLSLALTVVSWAQSTTPNQTAAPEQNTSSPDGKSACPCCDKMASADHADQHKGMQACMHHAASSKDAKETTSCCSDKEAKGEMACCGGKDAKACVKGDKSSAACCGKCAEGHEMACCSGKDGDAASHGCCGGKQCGKHEHHEPPAPGN
jgi:hypothetical protein